MLRCNNRLVITLVMILLLLIPTERVLCQTTIALSPSTAPLMPAFSTPIKRQIQAAILSREKLETSLLREERPVLFVIGINSELLSQAAYHYLGRAAVIQLEVEDPVHAAFLHDVFGIPRPTSPTLGYLRRSEESLRAIREGRETKLNTSKDEKRIANGSDLTGEGGARWLRLTLGLEPGVPILEEITTVSQRKLTSRPAKVVIVFYDGQASGIQKLHQDAQLSELAVTATSYIGLVDFYKWDWRQDFAKKTWEGWVADTLRAVATETVVPVAWETRPDNWALQRRHPALEILSGDNSGERVVLYVELYHRIEPAPPSRTTTVVQRTGLLSPVSNARQE